MRLKKILVFGDAISSKNGGSASFCELCLALGERYNLTIATKLGRFDGVIYNHINYKALRDRLRTIPEGYIDQRYRPYSFGIKIVGILSRLLFGQLKLANIDLVIDCLGLNSDVVKEFQRNGIRVYRMHNGSVAAFTEFFGRAQYYSKEENLNYYISAMSRYSGLLFQSQEQLIESQKVVRIGDYHCLPPSCNEAAIDKIAFVKTTRDESEIRIVQVGSIQPRKNQLRSIELVSSLRAAGLKVCLHLIGVIHDKDYYNFLLQVIGKNDAFDYVFFTGFRSDYLKFIVGANALIIPAEAEGISRALREAFYAKVLVLGRSISGMKSFIENGQIVDIENMELQQMVKLFLNRQERENICNAARSYYDEFYSWTNYAERVARIIQA